MKTRLRVRSAAVAVLAAVIIAPPAWAGTPTEALRGHLERVFAVLDEPALKGVVNAVARHRALRTLTVAAVDFPEAARRSLGAHWDARTPAEREHFVALFTDLIDHAYLGRLSHDGERLAYDDETISGRDAVVRARALGKNGDVTPVIFGMRQGDDQQWRISDVSFEGMSLVGNYRAQFNKIIRASSYEELVTRLETKTRTDAQASVGGGDAPSKAVAP